MERPTAPVTSHIFKTVGRAPARHSRMPAAESALREGGGQAIFIAKKDSGPHIFIPSETDSLFPFPTISPISVPITQIVSNSKDTRMIKQ